MDDHSKHSHWSCHYFRGGEGRKYGLGAGSPKLEIITDRLHAFAVIEPTASNHCTELKTLTRDNHCCLDSPTDS